MAFDEDSDNPESDRSKDASSRNDSNSESKGTSKADLGNVGFMVDGLDMRELDVDQIEIMSDLDAFIEQTVSEPPALESFAPPPSEDADKKSIGEEGDGDGQSSRRESKRQSAAKDSATPSTAKNFKKKPPARGEKTKPKSEAPRSPLPPLWPADLDSPPAAVKNIQDEAFKDFFAKNVTRTKNFRLTANNLLYYPQLSFGHGVKYGGNVTLSQTAMLILAAAKTEALRLGQQEIGCEHILIALLQNHGFAAGQLVLSLHLNAIGKPYSLGDLAGTARRIIDGPNIVTFDRLSAIARSGKVDMYFTAEADQMLVDAMYSAAKTGQSSVASKHILAALIDCENGDVQAALGALYVTRNEIHSALSICPDVDDLREFTLYALCSILYCFIRFRLFQAPVQRYRDYAVKKDRVIERKDNPRIRIESADGNSADGKQPQRKKM